MQRMKTKLHKDDPAQEVIMIEAAKEGRHLASKLNPKIRKNDDHDQLRAQESKVEPIIQACMKLLLNQLAIIGGCVDQTPPVTQEKNRHPLNKQRSRTR